MKLQRLYLQDYQVLRNLRIEFSPWLEPETSRILEPTYSLDFLVGVNGTGKSTVLNVLHDLMQRLEGYAGQKIEYGFELEYDLGFGNNTRRVKISNLPEDAEDLAAVPIQPLISVLVNGEASRLVNGVETPWNQDLENLLPDTVVFFSTGSEDRRKEADSLQARNGRNLDFLRSQSLEALATHELPSRIAHLQDPEPISEESSEQQDSEYPRIYSNQLPMVTLCGLLADLAEAPSHRRLTQVLKDAKLVEHDDGPLAGFSLKFRMAEGLTSPGERREVKRLAKLATRRLCLGTDYLLVFNLRQPERAIAHDIMQEFSSGLRLFKTLASLGKVNENGQSVLQEVNLFLERPPTAPHPDRPVEYPPLHLLEWFSDGERSFLGRMCLFTLLGASEALILLDEPEVHFNDFWKRKIVHLLDQTLKNRHSHVLITTHSSITLTDVPKEDIIVLDRNANYTNRSLNPGIATLAANPSDILVHVFGAPYAAGEYSIDYIDDVLEFLSNQAPDQRRNGIENLLNQVGPGYWNYKIRRELLAVEQAMEQATE